MGEQTAQREHDEMAMGKKAVFLGGKHKERAPIAKSFESVVLIYHARHSPTASSTATCPRRFSTSVTLSAIVAVVRVVTQIEVALLLILSLLGCVAS